MDTESVRLFVLAADKLNISAAGRELGMAPSMASAKLAKLERLLGADLLHRSTRKVALSLEGADFLPYAKEILAQEDAARAALGHGDATVTGTLRFTAPSTFAQLYIAPILPEFLQLHPGNTLDLRLTDMEFDLIQGSFDLALRNSTLSDSSLKGRKLANDMRILCASPEYLNQQGTPSHPDDLATHQFIVFKEPALIKFVGYDGSTEEFDPRLTKSRLIVDDGLSQKVATIAGAGISMNSLWSVHRELADGSLIHVLPDYTIDDQTGLWLIYPKSNVLTVKVRVFIDFLIERIGDSPIWPDYTLAKPVI
ncbi:LysR family transcriptional regulator [Psychrobacter sp. Cmf 22.2]|uniref:LysR family transcriptional regulator n=1 Tax=Psychrobacter sp. Cmf 22.2 TaxID=1926478 RepID=UPI00094700FC|nr:LysR family transcriptional regulator [Psychrobacter sp. Cmf 22.2]OLF38309.1 LysR family transcriptional regulator [Psychrobacter sp. Cmf 22.2]